MAARSHGLKQSHNLPNVNTRGERNRRHDRVDETAGEGRLRRGGTAAIELARAGPGCSERAARCIMGAQMTERRMAYDILIKNGTIVDGSGAAARTGNLAIAGAVLRSA